MRKNVKEREDGATAYGRPRLLTHDEIIAAAIEIGLETLTMKKLADHLGVGTATLYQYWGNRTELVQAAAVRALSQLDWPKDQGQHWSAYCWEFVERVVDYLSDHPSLVLSNHARDFGYEVQFRLVEQFLEVLVARGFTAAEAMRVYNVVGVIAFGGAVETVRQKQFKLHDAEGGKAAKAQLDSLGKDDLPQLRAALSEYTTSPRDKIRDALRSALVAIALERGEGADAVVFD